MGKELEVIPEVIDVEIEGVWYSSNNSGGDWWLDDDDWYALERDGWVVKWYRDETDWNGKPYKDGRFLDALATKAFLPDASERVAIARWADATGLNPDAEGCYCCGQPHYFSTGFADRGY
jgi:hypothetical protein